MVQFIATTTGNGEEHALRAMFAARKEVFIDLLKWDLPALDGRYEIDQFDDEHAQYLILLDDEGRHRASTRLLPTTRAHLLDTLFPQLCGESPPSGRHVEEITRFCLDRRLRAPERREARNQLVTAIVEHALEYGCTNYTGVAEVGWLQQILSFGWDCAPLGLPVRHDGKLIGALSINIAADTPARLAAHGIWSPVITAPLPQLRAAGARG